MIPGGPVLDPFGGTGTTGVAAETTGRRARVIEPNPEYAANTRQCIAKADDRETGLDEAPD
jgi:DNA modification methylase